MLVRDLLEVDDNIVGLDIDVRDLKLKLKENIRIGAQVEGTIYDKFVRQEKDATVYQMVGSVDKAIYRTCIRREIQSYFNLEVDKSGQTKPRKVGYEWRKIPKEILELKIVSLTPSNIFFRPYNLGSHVGFHGYSLWCISEADKAVDTQPLFQEELDPNQISFDDLEGGLT